MQTNIHSSILFLINEEIDLQLTKQALTEAEPAEPTTDASSEQTPVEAPEASDNEADLGDAGNISGDTGDLSAPLEGGEEADLDDMEMGGDEAGGDDSLFGGFGGGGGGGGGLGLGGDGDLSGDDNKEGTPPPKPIDYNPFKDAHTLEDRLRVVLDTAESLSSSTQNPQVVLKTIKGMIQNGFDKPEKAAKAISDLFDTNNPVLQQVSRRLAFYTWGI